MRVPGRSPAIDEMNTIALPSLIRGGRGAAQQEVRAHVDGEDEIPLLGRSLLQPAALADTDVADEAVDTAQRDERFVLDPLARRLVGYVADDDRWRCPFGLHQSRGLSAARASRSTHATSRPLSRRARRRPTVAHRGVGIVGPRVPAPITTMRRPARRWVTVRMLPEVGSPPPAAPRSNVGRSNRGGSVATAEEVRDALFERIAYHTISADTDEVLTLAKAYSMLVERDDDEDDDEDDDDDD